MENRHHNRCAAHQPCTAPGCTRNCVVGADSQPALTCAQHHVCEPPGRNCGVPLPIETAFCVLHDCRIHACDRPRDLDRHANNIYCRDRKSISSLLDAHQIADTQDRHLRKRQLPRPRPPAQQPQLPQLPRPHVRVPRLHGPDGRHEAILPTPLLRQAALQQRQHPCPGVLRDALLPRHGLRGAGQGGRRVVRRQGVHARRVRPGARSPADIVRGAPGRCRARRAYRPGSGAGEAGGGGRGRSGEGGGGGSAAAIGGAKGAADTRLEERAWPEEGQAQGERALGMGQGLGFGQRPGRSGVGLGEAVGSGAAEGERVVVAGRGGEAEGEGAREGEEAVALGGCRAAGSGSGSSPVAAAAVEVQC